VGKGFQATPGEAGLVTLGSSLASGEVLFLPAGSSLTKESLARANREGWQRPGFDLRAMYPGKHQRIPLTQGASGYYFSVSGKVQGSSARGFLAGLLGPEGRQNYWVLAWVTPEAWSDFQPLARRILDGLRVR
jgi:hypothetical protein